MVDGASKDVLAYLPAVDQEHSSAYGAGVLEFVALQRDHDAEEVP